MSIQKTCCVVGHHDIPLQKPEKLRELLKHEINHAIDDGYTHFIIGSTNKVAIMFAGLVLEFRDNGSKITLECDIPYRDYLKLQHPSFDMIVGTCNIVSVISQEYEKSCFRAYNRIMVENSSRVIAVYDGRESGETAYTVGLCSCNGTRGAHRLPLTQGDTL